MYDFLNGLFGGIYYFFNGLFSNLFSFLSNLGSEIVDGISSLANFLGRTLNNLFEALKQVLVWLFQPIYDLIMGFVYLLIKIGELLIFIVRIIARLFQIAEEIISEIYNTLLGFSYTGSTNYYHIPSAYNDLFQQVTGFFNQTGFNTIAYIMAVFVWILAAYAAIKIMTREE